MSEKQMPFLIEKWLIELKKGFAKPLLMEFLGQNHDYPYNLTKKINSRTNGSIHIAGSNIYPLLSGMKKKGLLETHESEETGKRVYALTKFGKDFRHQFREEVKVFLTLMLELLVGDEDN